MAKTTFLMKKDFITEDDRELFTTEELGELILAWSDYLTTGVIPTFPDRALRIKFNEWKEFYLDSEAEYQRIVEIRSEAGKKGGRPKKDEETDGEEEKPNAFFEKQTKAKKPNAFFEKQNNPNANANANANALIYKESTREKAGADAPTTPARFSKPTINEIDAYRQERGSSVNPTAFYNYYEANGWKVGKNPMKDWRAAFRTWEQREKERPQAPTPVQPARQDKTAIIEHDYSQYKQEKKDPFASYMELRKLDN